MEVKRPCYNLQQTRKENQYSGQEYYNRGESTKGKAEMKEHNKHYYIIHICVYIVAKMHILKYPTSFILLFSIQALPRAVCTGSNLF